MCNPRFSAVYVAAVVLGMGAALLEAANFWETKKFSEWTPKEVQKVLRDSPWARQVEVHLQGPAVGGVAGGRGSRRGGGGGMPNMGAESGGLESGGGGMPGRGAGMESMSSSPPAATVIVRWHSALPVKQAVARARFGDEAATSPEAAKMLSRKEERYVIGVIGLPMQAVRQQMKPDAMLVIKGKPPIALANAQAERNERTLNLYLFFPRDAQPIALEDGDVELRLKLGRVEIKRKFRLKEMVFEGKLEI